jgi:WD40 repeat protein
MKIVMLLFSSTVLLASCAVQPADLPEATRVSTVQIIAVAPSLQATGTIKASATGSHRPTDGAAPLITPTPLPTVNPTPFGGPIMIGPPLPTPELAPSAIVPSNLARLTEVTRLGTPTNLGVSDVIFTRDGQKLVATWGDLTTWQMPAGEEISSIPLSTTSWTPLALSPDGLIAAIGNRETLGTVELWNLSTRQLARYHQGGQRVTAIEFNSTGTLLAAGRSDGSVTIWDVATGSLLHELQKNSWSGCTGMAFHPTRDEIAASGAGNMVQIWNAWSGALEGGFTLPNPPASCVLSSLAYRPDGSALAAALFSERSIALWEDNTFVRILTHANGGTIWEIDWSPDGRLLSSVENAGPSGQQIVLWDTQANSVATTLEEWRGGATFSPDGAILATEGLDGLNATLRVLSIP